MRQDAETVLNLPMIEKIITSFGSAYVNKDEPYFSEVEKCGEIIASKGFVVCSGGYAGTMEAISKGAKSSGGRTIGITIKDWNNNVNDYIDEEIKCNTLLERLTLLITKADSYIVFKGGTGTLTEIALTLEMMNKNKMNRKKIYFYGEFWKSTIETLKQDSQKLSSIIDEIICFLKKPEDLRTIL